MSVATLRDWRMQVVRLVQVVMAALMLSLIAAEPAHAGSATSNGITFSDTSLVQAQRGVVYETMAGSTTDLNTRVSGGTAPYTYALVSGALPDGFFLSSSGHLTGVNCTSVNGTYKFTVNITDSTGTTGVFNLSINMTAGPAGACNLTLTPSSLNDTTVLGTSYSNAITATGGNGGPYTFTLASGALPAGITLNSDGTITGTSTATGTYSFAVKATDSLGNAGYQTTTITVTSGATLVIGPATLPDGINGAPYSQAITPSGGTGPYTCSITSGSLPAGLSLSSNTITGTPVAEGSYSFAVTCTDSPGLSSTKSYNLVVAPGQVLNLGPSTLPGGTNGTAYSAAVTATGGTGTGYVYTVDSGSLPTGLNLNPTTGAISGTSTAAGTFTFTVKAIDSAGNYQTKSYTVTIAPGQVLNLGPATLANATNGSAYSQTVVATGGSGTGYVYTLDSGSLPTGLTPNGTTGVISGTPTSAGTYTFAIKAVDSAGNYQTRTYTLTVNAGGVLAIGPAALPNGTNGAPYSQSVVATGGTGTGYVYTLDSGSLPSGLTLDSASGVISGTPSAAGTYSFTVKAVDSAGNYQTKTYTVTIDPGAVLAIGPSALPNGTNGTAYNQMVAATGGTGTGYVYSLDSGSLPAGLTLNGASGAIAGTPTTPGTYTFAVKAVDSAGNYKVKPYTVTINPGAVLNLGPQGLAAPTQGLPYAATVVAAGGSGTGYVYSIDSGALPAGLALNPATGAITGKTLASGTYSFTVKAVDSQGNWGSRTYTFTILERPDPTRDGEVTALTDGQFRTASRFAEGQASNAMRHLESLHGGLRCGIRNDLKVAAGMPGQNAAPGDPAAGGVAGAGAARRAANDNPKAVTCDETQPSMALWATGSINRENDNLNRFATDAMTLGLDYQLANKAIVGGAFGLGWGDNRFGRNGTKSDDRATTAMGYASLGFSDKLFLDLAMGKTWVRYDGQRYVTLDQSVAQFKRKGDVAFGSAALTFEQPLGAVLVAGAMRYDYLDINLGAYGEASASNYALTYQASHQLVQLLTVGVRGETTFVYGWGKLTPLARIEVRHRVSGAYDQLLAYSDLLTRTYVLHRGQVSNDTLSASLGGRVSVGLYEVSAEYGTSSTALDSLSGGELRVSLRRKF